MPSERIRIGDDYYLLASALAPRGRRLVLNDADTFAIFDEAGDVPLSGHDTFGVFSRGTRFLARLELRVNRTFPFLLSAASADDGSEVVSYLTNPDERRDGEIIVKRDSVALQRRKALIDGALLETLHLHHYGAEPLSLHLELLFGVDFADIFELRGVQRQRRGVMAEPRVEGDRVSFSYTGLDGLVRVTAIRFAPAAWRVSADRAMLELHLQPGEQAQISWFIGCQVGEHLAPTTDFDAALGAVRLARRNRVESFPEITSNNEAFDEWVAGSLRDIAMLCAPWPTGPYVYAGIPWFATMFGRDGLLTAFEALAFAPALAAGTLRGLAAVQGSGYDARRDEEPGKILHELRSGEMAATGEVPFGRYYGSVDATPLFLCLLGAYADRTGDLALVQELWPSALAAMAWIERNLDARGYVAYERRTSKGLVNQGWKDSHDSISHADGRLAEPPIALCEVQGYVYGAFSALGALARRLGQTAEAEAWTTQAAALRERFERDFWMPEESCYALALDRDGQPCRVVTSNAGHCLLAGIATREHAAEVVARLMRDDCFCGWGVRTLSDRARRFNPISYHNGSVWPHDNALVAAGFARYGFNRRAADVMGALFEASTRLDDRRLPELFCGFPRSQCAQPVPYPVACRPQAWAAGSAFLLLHAALGLQLDAWKRRVSFSGAVLPEGIDYVDIRRLRLNDASLDVRIRRGGRAASVEILERTGELEVIVRK